VNEQRLRTALGFSAKAGKCISGDFAAERAIRKRQALLVALDAEASANTKEKYAHLAASAGIPCIELAGMGAAIGKYGRMVAVVTEGGFARMICEASTESTHGGMENGK